MVYQVKQLAELNKANRGGLGKDEIWRECAEGRKTVILDEFGVRVGVVVGLLVVFAICICLLTFCAGIMNEAPKRNSTRERKPNRFLQLDDIDPPNHSASRLPEPRDSRANNEINQLAKLLLRFVLTANKKLHEYSELNPQKGISQQPPTTSNSNGHSSAVTKGAEQNGLNGEGVLSGQPRRGQDGRRSGQEEVPRSGIKPGEEKPQPPSRPSQNGKVPADTGLNSIRGRQPSSETQRTGAPQMQQGKTSQKPESRERKKKPVVVLEQRGQKQELKPFKRQSYHVAIAYHIHIKKVRPDGAEGPNARNVDPTYHARRLREMQERQQ